MYERRVGVRLGSILHLYAISLYVPLPRLSAGDSERALKLLDGAVEAHLKLLHGEPFGTAYLRALNPDMLLQVAREYQRHAPDTASALGDDSGLSAPTPSALK